ncbi:MFS transporter [Oleisolibacter albus]|uniref:MFS transporter n=1 Tax=Oleisolibacter albus TaxID=2171757 RepID=UPI0013901FBD|nr:MFS transporter [Oleisolibacter albus]
MTGSVPLSPPGVAQGAAGPDAPVGHLRALAFGTGSVAAATFNVTPQLWLLFFLTETLSVPAAWAGLAVLVPKAWEFLFDPAVGWLSDRARARHGVRWPWLLAGAVLFPGAFMALFGPPVFADWRWTLGWVTGAFLLATSAYSIFAIPFVALPGEVSRDPAVRTRVVAWRMAFVGVGVLMAGGLAPVLVEQGGGGRAGFAHMAGVLSVVCTLTMLLAAMAARGFPRQAPVHGGSGGGSGDGSGAPGDRALALLLANRAYRWLWGAYLLQMVAIAVTAAMLPYAVTHVMGAPADHAALLFVAMTLGSIFTMPLWTWARRRMGTLPAYGAATLLCVAGSVALYDVVLASLPLACLAAFLAGVGQAGQQLLPFALLPAVTERSGGPHADPLRHGGLFAGVWVAGEKLGLALGGALAGLLLGLAGYVEGGQGQAPGVVAWIPVLFALVPAGIFLVSLLPLRLLDRLAPGLGD